MGKTVLFLPALALAALACPNIALANTLGQMAEQTTISGFMTTRYSITDEEAMLDGGFDQEGINEDGSFRGSKLGINLRTRISDRVRFASQFVSAIEDNDYDTKVDWAFISFRLNDEFSLRTGKIKFPVGLVNEFVDVGIAYPWVSPPRVIYSQSPQGPQAIREGYTGASLLWSRHIGDWSISTDLFGGQVNIPMMKVKGMGGLSLEADWLGKVRFKTSTYTGEMKAANPVSGMGAMMDGESHGAVTAGVEVDWHNLVTYAEWADVSMGMEDMQGVSVGDSESWYATLGYRFFDRLLPHATYESWERETGNEHIIRSLGVTCNLTPRVAFKLEQSRIDTEGTGLFVDGTGLRNDPSRLGDPIAPDGDTNMTSIAVDVVF